MGSKVRKGLFIKHFLSLPAKQQLPVATTVQQEGSVWRVTFNPSIIQQAKVSTAGLLGDFIIRYDVQRDAGVGDVQVRGRPPFGANSTPPPPPLHSSCPLLSSSKVLNGHFVHYFAPSNLPAVPKNVVFVIDTSASMLGKKIRQVRDNVLLPDAVLLFCWLLGTFFKFKHHLSSEPSIA